MNLMRLNKINACMPVHRLLQIELSDRTQNSIFEILQRFDHLIYRLGTISQLEQFIVNKFGKNEKQGYHSAFMISNPIFSCLQYEICDCLSAIRTAQDSLLDFIRINWQTQIPRSMHKFGNKLQKGQYPQSIPVDILNSIENYWKQHGIKVKAYRDVLIHHEILANRTEIHAEGSNKYIISLLPDNPEEKAPWKFKFDENHNALPYCKDEVKEILNLVDEILESLCEKVGAPSPPSKRVYTEFSSPKISFQISTGHKYKINDNKK